MQLMKFVGKDIVLHYKGGKTEKLKIHNYEGPYLLLVAPSSSLGHIGLEVAKWQIKEEDGQLHAYPKT